MDKKIESFIKEQKNLTLCTSVNNLPSCANCFYAYMSDGNFFVFKWNRTTKHIANSLINYNIAGTVIPDISKIGTIKGIQFTGKFTVPIGDVLDKAKKIYYARHPFALPMPGELWMIELISVKMTDNTLGFGGKLMWEKSSVMKQISPTIGGGFYQPKL